MQIVNTHYHRVILNTVATTFITTPLMHNVSNSSSCLVKLKEKLQLPGHTITHIKNLSHTLHSIVFTSTFPSVRLLFFSHHENCKYLTWTLDIIQTMTIKDPSDFLSLFPGLGSCGTYFLPLLYHVSKRTGSSHHIRNVSGRQFVATGDKDDMYLLRFRCCCLEASRNQSYFVKQKTASSAYET